jgi:hypothetical protein
MWLSSRTRGGRGMEFGDKEWFEKLEQISDFPSVFAFYVCTDKSINSKIVETKAENLGNIQYKTLEPPLLFNDEKTALASVMRCNTSQEYYEECKRLKDIWTTDK